MREKEDAAKCRMWYEGMRDYLMREYNIQSIWIFDNSHHTPIPNIREVLWREAYALFGVSTTMLGKISHKHHSTIIQGMRRAFALLSSHDDVVCDIYDKIKLIDKLHNMDKKKKIYVSLPFGEDEEANKERSKRAIAKFQAQGFEKVVTSLDILSMCYDMNREQEWIGRRIENILLADVAVFANGWYEDKICLLEKDACQRFGIETFTDGKI